MIAFYCKGLSMDPLLRDGDLIFVETLEKERISLGDIVAFKNGQEGDSIAHRVVAILPSKDKQLYLLQGDFTDKEGIDTVAFEDIVGKVVGFKRDNKLISLQSRYVGILRSIWNHFPAGARFILPLLKWRSLYLKFNFICHPRFFIRNPHKSLDSIRSKFNQIEEIGFHREYVNAGLEDWEGEVCAQYLKPRSRILDIGCGAGREAIALTERGFEVAGIDISPDMIRAAQEESRRRHLSIRFEVMTVSEIEFPKDYFDYCIFSHNVYSFIPTRDLRVESLRRIKECLKAGGLIFLNEDIMEQPSFLSGQNFLNTIRRFRNFILPGVFSSEPGDVLRRGVSPASRMNTFCFFHHFYSGKEIQDEFKDAGLEVVESEIEDICIAKVKA